MRKSTKNQRPSPFKTHASVAAVARQLWENDGQPTGRYLEYWLRAEHQVASGASPNPRPDSRPEG